MSLQGDRIRIGWLMYLQSAPAVRIWAGVGDLRIPADYVDTAGGVYKGIGQIVSISSLKIPVNGHFAQHELTLGAPNATAIVLANAERESLRYATVSIGLLEFDENYQPAGPVTWLWDAACDGPRTRRTGAQNGAARTISLVCTAGESQRKRAPLNRWTGVDQRLRSADDAGCDRTNLYDAGTTERWPS